MSGSFSEVLPASWRGVPFGVESGERRPGRKKVEHDYPYRDGITIEDLGRKGREIRVVGFLVSNSRVYGGGDVLAQVALMEAVCELSGPGVLIHPTRGIMLVDLMDCVISENWENGQSFALQFVFKEGGQQLFPSIASALTGLISGAAGAALGAIAGSFGAAVAPLISSAATAALTSVAASWIGKITAVAGDATSVYGTVSQLGGANYGRYFNGGNAGFQQGLSSPYAGATTVNDLLALGSARQQAVVAAGAALTATIGLLGVSAMPADVAAAAQVLVAALQGAPADPADGVRLLVALSSYDPGTGASASPAGAALSTLFRQSVAIGAAQVGSAYAPASADDANTVRAQIIAPIDAEIAVAGATFDDAAFSSLRGLRQAVYNDLGQRGASLPSLITVATPKALPAVVHAQRLYLDAARRDELVTEADPIHPLFMPVSFKALAS